MLSYTGLGVGGGWGESYGSTHLFSSNGDFTGDDDGMERPSVICSRSPIAKSGNRSSRAPLSSELPSSSRIRANHPHSGVGRRSTTIALLDLGPHPSRSLHLIGTGCPCNFC